MSSNNNGSEIHAIKFGRNIIKYKLTHSEKKSISISVFPDKTVLVRAPINARFDEIQNRIRKKSIWILKQLDYFDRFQPLLTERKYISGETLFYLGRQYRLKVIRGNPEAVKLKGKFLWVHTNDKNDTTRIKMLVDDWYRIREIELLSKKLEILMHKACELGIAEPEIKYRYMKKRWGSCTKSSTILLNTELIKAPAYCIDYVIAHELCHLNYRNHSTAFWRLLSRLMPDWESRKLRLEMIVI